MTKRHIGARVSEEALKALSEYAEENGLNNSETLEAIVCHFFEVELKTKAAIVLAKDIKIFQLETELEKTNKGKNES
jgi:hypothetical protein